MAISPGDVEPLQGRKFFGGAGSRGAQAPDEARSVPQEIERRNSIGCEEYLNGIERSAPRGVK